MSWKKTAVIVLVGALLLAIGAGIGAGTAILHVRKVIAPKADPTERIGDLVMASITDEVDLSAGEKEKIAELVRRHMVAMDRMNNEYGQSIQGVFDDMCAEICEVLGYQRTHTWRDAVRRSFGERAAQRIKGSPAPDE
jgi:hypothetical protein